MDQDDAIDLIRGAVTTTGGTWADLGAGSGTFTRAVASLIGGGGVVYAVDRDANSLRGLAGRSSPDSAEIRTMVADLTDRLDLRALRGVVVANALHYVPYADQPRVLAQIAALLHPGGVLVIVEYERRDANRWVPYPVTFDALQALSRDAKLAAPVLLATRPSRYTGSIYSAVVRLANARA